DAGRAAAVESAADGGGRSVEGDVPAGRGQRRAGTGTGAHQRFGQAVLGGDGLEGEAALVAQPGPVDRVRGDAVEAQHLVTGRVDGHPTSDRTGGAGRLGGLEVPRAGLEPVRLGGQRADRADLHGVAREVRVERLAGERVDLGVGAAVDEVDQRVVGDLGGEAGAAVAEDA